MLHFSYGFKPFLKIFFYAWYFFWELVSTFLTLEVQLQWKQGIPYKEEIPYKEHYRNISI